MSSLVVFFLTLGFKSLVQANLTVLNCPSSFRPLLPLPGSSPCLFLLLLGIQVYSLQLAAIPMHISLPFGLSSLCCLLLLGPAFTCSQGQDVFVHLSALQPSVFVAFMQHCFWRSNSVPIGLRTVYLHSCQLVRDADSVSLQKAIMPCALKTWAVHPIPWNIS